MFRLRFASLNMTNHGAPPKGVAVVQVEGQLSCRVLDVTYSYVKEPI